VTEKVMRQAPCPVMVVPRRAGDADVEASVRLQRVLCALDFSSASMPIVGYARAMADERDGHVTLLHVLEVPPELRVSPSMEGIDVPAIRAQAEAEALRQLRELVPEGVRREGGVDTMVREGAAYREILKVAAEEHADLIVMGMHGRGALDRLVFGSNTARVARGAACPVLIVRAD
jgi:universal stress protein A